MTTLEMFMICMVEEDTCPMCLGWLDDEYRCAQCKGDVNYLLRLAADDAIQMMIYDPDGEVL